MRSLAILFVSLALTLGCKQGLGERCQLHRDCALGLTCVVRKGETCVQGGTCQPEREEGRRCESTGDCRMGLVCAPSTACSEEGKSVCSTLDMAESRDLRAAVSDLASLGAQPSDGSL